MTTAADYDAIIITVLKKLAADADLDERSARSEASRLAEVAGEAQKYAQACVDDAHNSFERARRLGDKAEAAEAAAVAYEKSVS